MPESSTILTPSHTTSRALTVHLATARPNGPGLLGEPTSGKEDIAAGSVFHQAASSDSQIAGLVPSTLSDFTTQLCEPLLDKYIPLTASHGPWIVQKTLLEIGLKNLPNLLPLKDPTNPPGLFSIATDLWRLLDQLRLAGVSAADLSLKDKAKGEELAQVLEAYEKALAEVDAKGNSLLDRSALLELALGQASKAKELLGSDQVQVPAGTLWTRAEAAWLKSFAGKGQLEVLPGPVTVLPSGKVPQGLGCLAEPNIDQIKASHPLALTFDPPTKGLDQTLTDNWTFFSASSPSAELKQGLRILAQKGIAWDQVQIMVTDPSAYGIAARGLMATSDIPFTLGFGMASGVSRPEQGILALLDWFEKKQQADMLEFAISQGWISTLDKEVSRRDLADNLSMMGIGWGADRYQPAFLDKLYALKKELVEQPRSYERAPDEEGFKALKDFASELVSGMPSPDADVEVSALANWLAARSARLASAWDEQDFGIKGQLVRAIRELSRESLGAPAISIDEACAVIRETLSDLATGAQGPKPGHLFMSDLTAGPVFRPHVLVLGLDEGRFPAGSRPNGFLDDSEMQALGLETLDDQVQRRIALALQSLAELGKPASLGLGFCRFDVVDNREQAPATLLLQLFRLKYGSAKSYDDLNQACGSPAGLPILKGSLALDEADVELSAVQNTGRIKAIAQSLPAARIAGRQAWDARLDHSKSGPADGELGAGLAGFKPLEESKDPDVMTWSHSSLDKLMGCPRQFFFQRVLKADAASESKGLPDDWLQPVDSGSLLHEYYEWYHTRLIKGEGTSWKEGKAEMDRLLARAEILIASPGKGIADSQKRLLLREAEQFDAYIQEHSPKAYKTHSVEMGLGDKYPLALMLADYGHLKIRGFADLVLSDKDDKNFTIWDYKTGSTYGQDEEDVSKNLQLLIYVAALQQELDHAGKGGKVVGGGYLYPTHRGGYEAYAYDVEAAQALGYITDTVGDVLQALGRGDFKVPVSPNCTFCDFKFACDTRQAISKSGAIAKAEKEAAKKMKAK